MINTSDSFGGRRFNYAPVSTDDQELNLQVDALVQCGIAKQNIFMDKISGAKSDRPGLGQCMEVLQPGDILVVWRLDRQLQRTSEIEVQQVNCLAFSRTTIFLG
jgi:DNA invertase Pin-like site-specific DNA recombinase